MGENVKRSEPVQACDSQNEAGVVCMCTFVHKLEVFIRRGTVAVVFNGFLRFLPFLNRWTRADLYFPKHREFLETLRQVWHYIDISVTRIKNY